jgi:aminoglycoside phosphotransferase (APT) family kinase protein
MGDPALPGLEAGPVTRWLTDHLDARPPFRYSLIAAGGSNLTFRVEDEAGAAWALRRPPVAGIIATAHDMGREWRILEALGRAGRVPVPAAVARCDDADVTGAPFYVMGFAEGTILRTSRDASTFDEAAASTATDSLVDTQVALHALDPVEVGLGDLTRRHEGYLARQLARWRSQVEQAKVRDLPLVEELHTRLERTIPPITDAPALVHGDYRFDNTVLGTDRRVTAVLDWELCTIGDAVADFAWSLRYWTDPGDPCPFLDDGPTLAPAFPRRAAVTQRYGAGSGRDLSVLPWLEVFSYWKMACLVEGVHARRLRGASGGGGGGDPASIAARVDTFLAHAADLAAGVL